MKRRIVNFMLSTFYKRQQRVVHDSEGNTYGTHIEQDTLSVMSHNYSLDRYYLTWYVVVLGIVFAKTLTPDLMQFNTIRRRKKFSLKVEVEEWNICL